MSSCPGRPAWPSVPPTKPSTKPPARGDLEPPVSPPLENDGHPVIVEVFAHALGELSIVFDQQHMKTGTVVHPSIMTETAPSCARQKQCGSNNGDQAAAACAEAGKGLCTDSSGTFRGGFYADTSLYGPGCLYATTAHNTAHWDYSTGFRCCAE